MTTTQPHQCHESLVAGAVNQGTNEALMGMTTTPDIYAETFHVVYDAARSAGASKADAADDATKAASRAYLASKNFDASPGED